MSDDLIRRSDAIDAIMETCCYCSETKVLTEIRNLPTIESKRGEWIYGEHDVAMCDGYRCNRCGFFVPWDYEHKFIDFINDYHFCPNCGADMREREGEW